MRRKRSERKLSVVTTLDRDEARERAQAIANYGAKRLPKGARIVVCVTDIDGEWVGVGSNTYSMDVEAILHSALLGADKPKFRSIIDIEAEADVAE